MRAICSPFPIKSPTRNQFPSGGRRPFDRAGFTLVEALVSVSLMAICGSLLLLAVETSVDTTTLSRDQMIATGIAKSLLEEAMGGKYGAPAALLLGPSTWKGEGAGRERYDEIGDYHHSSYKKITDTWGSLRGRADGKGGQRHGNFQLPSNYFSSWRQKIEVYYVDEADPSQRLTGQSTSDLRAVEVTIVRQNQNGNYETLSQLRRVIAYVPSP